MNRNWYLIGNGSSFDGDMDISELCVNYHNRGNTDDIDAFYYRYMSAILTYWDDFDMMYNSTTREEFEDLFVKERKPIDDVYNNTNADPGNYYDRLVDYKKNNDLTKLRDILDNHINNIKKAYNEVPVNRDFLQLAVYNTFIYLSDILCFGYAMAQPPYDESINNENRSNYILINKTGFFSFNSYMFALANGVTLLGAPTTFSYYDNKAACPGDFLYHDLGHGFSLAFTPGDQEIKNLYKAILTGDYNTNEKEALIFVMWFNVHEARDIIELNCRFYNTLFRNSENTGLINFIGIFSPIERETLDKIKQNYDEILDSSDRHLFTPLDDINLRIKMIRRHASKSEGSNLDSLPLDYKQIVEEYIFDDFMYPNIYRYDIVNTHILTIYGIYLYKKLLKTL